MDTYKPDKLKYRCFQSQKSVFYSVDKDKILKSYQYK